MFGCNQTGCYKSCRRPRHDRILGSANQSRAPPDRPWSTMSTQRILIYLLRRDLRLADNPILHELSRLTKQSTPPFTHLLPLYVFPAQQLEVSGFLTKPDARSPYPEARSLAGGFWRCGPHRARFLAEAVWDVKTGLESIGSGLVLRAGKLGDVVGALLEGFRGGNAEVVGLWMTEEEGVEEKEEEKEVRRMVEKSSVEFKLWTDEKYFIDEYALSSRPLGWSMLALTLDAVEIYLSKAHPIFPISLPRTARWWSP